MQSVGTQIRTARLQAGLSLEQVSAQTRISCRVLQAIEDDDLRLVTSAFFYKSFVRQFCEQVGLSFEDMRVSVSVAMDAFPEPLSQGQGEAVFRSAVIKPVRRVRRLRRFYPALSLATVLIACSGFYAYYKGARVGTPHPMMQGKIDAAQPDAETVLRGRVEPASPIAEPTAAIPAQPDGRFRVEVSAVERTWLSIRADGKQVYSGTLEVDQTKVLEGREEGQLRTGNAGGVSIVFNGKPIGLAGPHGSVRTVVFTRDNYQVLPAFRAAIPVIPVTVGGLLLLPPVR